MAAGGSNISSTKSKNARQIPWSRSESLSIAVYFKDEGEVVQIETKDKLTILLKSKRVFVVLRKKDGAVAVLKDVRFKKKCPRAMFNLCDHKGLEGAGMTLRYAVAETDWSERKKKATLHKGDIILILANIHGHHVVGMTQTNNVEVFPSNVVSYLTKPRLILRDGMVIKMTSVYNNHTRQLFKSTGELFGWKRMDGQAVLLDSYRETEGHTMNGNEEGLYYDLPPLEKCIAKKREEAYYANPNLTEKVQASYYRPLPAQNGGYTSLTESDPNKVQASYYRPLPAQNGGYTLLTEIDSNKTEDKDDHEWSDDDVYIAWERDDNQGNDDSGYDRPMRTVEGLSETPGTAVGNEEPVFIERTEQGENPYRGPVPAPRSTVSENLDSTENTPTEYQRPVPTQRSTSYENIHCTEDPYQEIVEEDDHQPSGNAEDGEVESLQSQVVLYEYCVTTPALHQCIAEHLVDEKRDEFGKLLKVPKNLRLQIETRDDNVIDKTAKLLDLWHERNGRNATVGVLVDALLKLHLEESTLLLTDMLEMLRIDDAQSEA